MLDRIIQDFVASFCSWRVDMGMITPPNNSSVSQTPLPPPTSTPTSGNKKLGAEDDDDYYRIMSRYPDHMLHCPQTSLYPIFFFIMERWEARRAAKLEVLPPSATPASNSKNE